MDYQHIADVLFGATATPPADESVSPTSNPHADVLYGEGAADGPGAWTRDPTERALFGDDHEPPQEMFPIETALRPALHERHDDVMTVLQLPKAERVERHREFAAAIRESGLDPNTVGQALYHLQTDAEIAAVRGEVEMPAAGETLGAMLPPRMIEDVLRGLRSWIGAERGERLVGALNEFLKEQPKLARILATPGVVSRLGFRPVLDQIIEHVRKREHV